MLYKERPSVYRIDRAQMVFVSVAGTKAEVGAMNENLIWKCEQWFGGQMHEQKLFPTEEQAREFARKLSGVAPDLVLKIEPMPIQLVWN